MYRMVITLVNVDLNCKKDFTTSGISICYVSEDYSHIFVVTNNLAPLCHTRYLSHANYDSLGD